MWQHGLLPLRSSPTTFPLAYEVLAEILLLDCNILAGLIILAEDCSIIAKTTKGLHA